jgi:uncharacterized membrane protein
VKPAVPVSEEATEIGRNIAAVQAFFERQANDLSASQRLAERIARAVGRPSSLALLVGIVVGWIVINTLLPFFGHEALDPAPYFWLQGLVSLTALLITTVVLIKQNRVARLAEQRDHLDLKVMMLIEQKAAKLIDLIEEMRRDAPDLPNRHDPRASALRQALRPDGVLAALGEDAPSAEGTD